MRVLPGGRFLILNQDSIYLVYPCVTRLSEDSFGPCPPFPTSNAPAPMYAPKESCHAQRAP